MGQSSILGGQRAAEQAAGRGADALGPGDSSGSGREIPGGRAHRGAGPHDAGALPADLGSDTDAAGTGERAAAVGDDIEEAADIAPDRVEGGGTDALDDALELDDVDDLALDESDEDEPVSR